MPLPYNTTALTKDQTPDVLASDMPSSNKDKRLVHRSLATEIIFVGVVCAAQLLTQAGLALSIAPQTLIAQSFHITDPGTASWFSAAYSLTVGTFILPAGRVGDVFGHKRFLAGGFAWFGVWSALAGCAAYSGPILFAFCRAMQGMGPAFMLPNAVAILGRAYEAGSMRQNMVYSLFGATAPSGFIVGAVFSSLLAQKTWWPWAYWVMALACLLFAVLSVFAVPATVRESAQEDGNDLFCQRVDLFGSVAGVSALILFNFAWNQGPVVGWTQPYTYSIMIVGILAFVLFIFIEKRATHPLIPFGVLKIDSLFTLACIGAGWSSFGIFVLYTWNFVVQFRHQTPLLSSAQFSPVAISGLCAAVGTGIALSNLRPSSVILVSMVGFAAGGAILATMPIHQTYWAQEFVGLIVLPWGMDMSFPAATIVLSRAMPRKHQGLAASLVNTFVNYSISIGLGFAGTVDSNVNDGGREVLRGFRGALYLGVGLAGLGVVVALLFCFVEWYRSDTCEKMEQESENKLDSA
ncbi:Major facilitator superfamily domain, general substrate transporter [Akanthomyces lecanii RCEF 1005]|uniref:Major facilitator superfamily domain, general substrate transporter n=1 Tax=Akanthomyces lecanii RCEF 1005 TaxID=1081108 RepID=A0A162K2X5_CORDF|nr:Major facilitator superfamily domain, general substrate transporter [Akanthomyces lecanii RCEF 1005]